MALADIAFLNIRSNHYLGRQITFSNHSILAMNRKVQAAFPPWEHKNSNIDFFKYLKIITRCLQT